MNGLQKILQTSSQLSVTNSLLTEVIDGWDEQLGILAAADIFGLWITESSDDINIRGGESRKHKTISTIPVAVVVPALVCVSCIIVQRIKMRHRG